MSSSWIEDRCWRCGYLLYGTIVPGIAYCPTCRMYQQLKQKSHRWIEDRCWLCGHLLYGTIISGMAYCPTCGIYQQLKQKY
ncbi:hypothetical protein [[Eubacterium] cellulosolvens]